MHLLKGSFVFAAVMVTLTSALPVEHARDHQGLAPLYVSPEAQVIHDSYIVMLKKDLPKEKAHAHHIWARGLHSGDSWSPRIGDLMDSSVAAGVTHTFDTKGIRGYIGRFSDAVLEKIRSSDEVAYVEPDQVVYALETELQRNAPWGLARVAHRDPLTLRTYNKYSYDSIAGANVTAYVVDTGVNIDHDDLKGRAVWGATMPDGDEDVDGNGHGSHVAGTIAGKRFGVAKKANIVAVKVLRSNGSGTMSDVVKGVLWTIEAHEEEQELRVKQGKKKTVAVANMSLGGGKARSLDDAVDAAVESGILYAVAAGNDNRDACNYSPAASKLAITVGASTLSDERAYFSNYGKCTDVFAPGLNIQSIWNSGPTSTNTISGTSMASPHVCGLAAYFLGLVPEGKEVSPQELKDKIIELSTKDVLEKMTEDTPNRLIYNNIEDLKW